MKFFSPRVNQAKVIKYTWRFLINCNAAHKSFKGIENQMSYHNYFCSYLHSKLRSLNLKMASFELPRFSSFFFLLSNLWRDHFCDYVTLLSFLSLFFIERVTGSEYTWGEPGMRQLDTNKTGTGVHFL